MIFFLKFLNIIFKIIEYPILYLEQLEKYRKKLIEKTNYCPFCGIKLELESKYCHNCGAFLNSQIHNQNQKQIKIISEKPLTINNETISNETNSEKTENTQNDNQSVHYQIRRENSSSGFVSFMFAMLSFFGILPFFSSTIAIITGGRKAGPLGIISRSIGWFLLGFYTILTFYIIL